MPVTRYLTMRHASTAWNEEQRIQGQRDVPLSPSGLSMARGWAEALRAHDFQAVLGSDLRRCVETAEIVAWGRDAPRMADVRLREQDWGEWAGLTLSQLTTREEFEEQARRGWDFRPPGGESRREVLVRALSALNDAALRWPCRSILVVTHQGVIRCLVYYLRGHSMQPGDPLLGKDYRLHLLTGNGRDLRLFGAGWPLPMKVEAAAS